MGFDLARARRETPGCEGVLHFNNAGAALMPRPVLDAAVGHLQLEAEIGGYEAARRALAAQEDLYDAAADLLGCSRDEIAFAENATRAWDMAFYSVPFRPGDRILTCVAEYGSNYIAFLQVAGRTGVRVEVIPNDEQGQISLEALRAALDHRVRLVAISHVPTNGGLVNPAAEVGRVLHGTGILYLLDACQSVGQMPVDVRTLGCDMLSATGRKYLRGPRGTGFLYVRRGVVEGLDPAFLDLQAATWVARDRYEMRPDARRFENWERNVAGQIGLAAALRYALDWGLEATYARIQALAEDLRARLAAVPGITVRDLGAERCGIVSFTVEGQDPAEVFAALGERRINVHVSAASSTLLDMEARGLERLLRASIHYYNSEAEVERFCGALEQIIAGR